MDGSPMLAVAFGFSVLLGIGSYNKFRAFRAFEAVVGNYRLLPNSLVAPAAAAIPAAEGALATLWLGAPWISGIALAASAATAMLMLGYGVAMAVNLLRGRSWIDCGCGGAEQVSWVLVGRNLGLAAIALTPLAITELSSPTWLDLAVSAPLLVVAALLYVATNALLANAAAMRASYAPSELA